MKIVMTVKNDVQLERNRLVVSKVTTKIWRISTQVLEILKNLFLNKPFLTKVDNVWAKKVQKNYVW